MENDGRAAEEDRFKENMGMGDGATVCLVHHDMGLEGMEGGRDCQEILRQLSLSRPNYTSQKGWQMAGAKARPEKVSSVTVALALSNDTL